MPREKYFLKQCVLKSDIKDVKSSGRERELGSLTIQRVYSAVVCILYSHCPCLCNHR